MKYRLKDRHIMPRGGFPFREPTLNWPPKGWNPYRDFNLIVGEIQMVRIQNPQAGLNPDREAVAAALDAYQCARLHNEERWCEPIPEPFVETKDGPSRPYVQPKQKRTCCGGRKR